MCVCISMYVCIYTYINIYINIYYYTLLGLLVDGLLDFTATVYLHLVYIATYIY